MLFEGRIGVATGADGVQEPVRLDRTLAQVITQGHARYREAVSRGSCYSISTAVAGVAPGTALSTTPPMVLWNPPNSGVAVSVIMSTLGYVSGTLGAGTVVYAAMPTNTPQQTVPSGGAELSLVTPCLIGGRKANAARAFQGSTIAATPVILRSAYILGAALATTATFQAITKDQLDGEYEILPGGLLVMQGVAAAGSTPLVLFGLTWEEIPL